jgi:Ca2+-binding RTX toxin-like protein
VGNTIAFVRQQPGCEPAESLGFVSPGSPEVIYGADAKRGSWAPPSWSPGGFLVEYGRDRGTVGETAPDGPLGDGGPGLYPSRAGDRIAVTVDSSLQVMQLGDIGGARRVVVPTYAKPSQSTGVAAWSPDQTRLAFGVMVGAHEAGIAVVNADGSDFKIIARGPNQSANPTWSPDGQTIAFETSRDRDFELYSVRVDGTGLRNLTNAPDAEDRMPAWSGNTIAFISSPHRTPPGEYGYSLYTMSPDGSNLRKQAQDLHPYSPIAWSPDRSKIAFASGRECLRWGIYVLDLATGAERRMTNRCIVSGTGRADSLTGTNFRDIVNGLGGADRIVGLGGDDLLHGDRGNDRLFGGAGRDTLFGGPGADRISCGAGRDIAYVDRHDRSARDCELVYRDRSK